MPEDKLLEEFTETLNNKIQKVIDYNEDDCRATMLVKDWLERNLSKTMEKR